jgi:peroxiredoxin
MNMTAEVGEKAPPFTLPTEDWEKTVSLEEYTKEGPVTLFFYPGDWSSVCTDQMGLIQKEIGRFEALAANVLAISAGTPWPHRAFAEDRGIEPLFSGFGGGVLEEYGVRHERGFPERAYFIVDRDGVIRVRQVEPTPKSQPDLDEVLDDLEGAL